MDKDRGQTQRRADHQGTHVLPETMREERERR